MITFVSAIESGFDGVGAAVVRPPSTMRSSIGFRSGQDAPRQGTVSVPASPGSVVKLAPSDAGSGRYGIPRSLVSLMTYSPGRSVSPLVWVDRFVGVAFGSELTTSAPGPGSMYEPDSRAATSNAASTF